MSKHIFSKQELDALTPNARIAVLSGSWWINVEGEPITADYAKQISEKSEREGFIKNYSSLDNAWSLVPEGARSVYFLGTPMAGATWWQCTLEGYTGAITQTPQEALIDAIFGDNGYWKMRYDVDVFEGINERTTEPIDFETWLQAREDSK